MLGHSARKLPLSPADTRVMLAARMVRLPTRREGSISRTSHTRFKLYPMHCMIVLYLIRVAQALARCVMKIHLINPNGSAAMTRSIAEVARRAAGEEIDLIVSTVAGAPISIEGYCDEALAVPGMLKRILVVDREGVDAHVIACFDDPGLDAAREVASVPVIGLCEAALVAASRLAKRFSVVTSLARSVPIIEELADRYGCGRNLLQVLSADIPVLDLESNSSVAVAKVAQAVDRAAKDARAEAVVLGCSGMSAHTEYFARTAGVPVIDGLGFAVRLAEAFAKSSMSISKVGSYATPLPKEGSILTSPQEPKVRRAEA